MAHDQALMYQGNQQASDILCLFQCSKIPKPTPGSSTICKISTLQLLPHPFQDFAS